MFLKKILINKPIATIALPFLLKLDNILYKLISRYSVIFHDGIHPKHDIIKYENWFVDRLNPSDTVVEIGSHKGEMSKKVAAKVTKLIAIEIVESNYNFAVKNNSRENIDYIHGDATKYDYSSLKIDNIILSNVLEHIEKRVDFLKTIVEKINWENNGKVLIRVPLRTRDWVTCYKKKRDIYYLLDPTHYIEYTEEEIIDEIQQSGLTVEEKDIRFGEIYLVCKKAN